MTVGVKIDGGGGGEETDNAETIGRSDDDGDTKKTTAPVPTFIKLSPRDNWWG